MVYRFETFRDDKGIVVLQSLKVLHLSIIPTRFYESPKLKNGMCELCMFTQIQSHNTDIRTEQFQETICTGLWLVHLY